MLMKQKTAIYSGHILDLHCVRLLNAATFCKKYAKLYFDAKHLEEGLTRGVIFGALFSILAPLGPILNAALNF